MRRIQTQEEKIAKKLSDIVSDVRIDLDLVGVYLARAFPNLTYRRLSVIIESAEQEKENTYDRLNHNTFF
jgi:hypothetical protein